MSQRNENTPLLLNVLPDDADENDNVDDPDDDDAEAVASFQRLCSSKLVGSSWNGSNNTIHDSNYDDGATTSDTATSETGASPYLSKSQSPTTTTTATTSKSIWKYLDKSAMQFALRMAILLAISGLFVLIRLENFVWPDAMWVLVSVLFVCWFPAMDAASVIEKIMQRLIGTFIGATIGLTCGFTSLLLEDQHAHKTLFMEVCLFVGTFGIIGAAGQFHVGELKVIRAYAYATILCVLTFCICLLPFGTAPPPGTGGGGHAAPTWQRGVMRVVNVMVGCLLGALGAILVCPKSTAAVLHEKTARQVHLCGEASWAVLHLAADQFAGKVHVHALAEELMASPLQTTQRWNVRRRNTTNGATSPSSSTTTSPSARQTSQKKKKSVADVALKKYEDAIADWKASKMLFPLTKFDPFSYETRAERRQHMAGFNKEIARTLARSLRIQTTIVLLDGMVRHDCAYDFQPDELVLFERIGNNIQIMLSTKRQYSRSKCNQAALGLFEDLETIRQRILTLSRIVSQPDDTTQQLRRSNMLQFRDSLLYELDGEQSGDPHHVDNDDDAGRGIPNFASALDNSLFLLQLVEHLILRALRLYQAWKQVQRQAAQLRDATVRLQRDTRESEQGKPGDSLRSLIGI